MVPVAQETTANTVRLPYSFSRRFSLVAWCEEAIRASVNQRYWLALACWRLRVKECVLCAAVWLTR